MKRIAVPLLSLIAACASDPIVGEWISAFDPSPAAEFRWRFEDDGTFRSRTIRTGIPRSTSGTWSRVDERHLHLCYATATACPSILDITLRGDVLLAGEHFYPAAPNRWAYGEQSCCQNGSPYSRTKTLELQANGALVYFEEWGLAGGLRSEGTWTESDLGFDFVFPSGIPDGIGSFADLADVGSPNAYVLR